jgi:hypothetical protein
MLDADPLANSRSRFLFDFLCSTCCLEEFAR